MITKGILKSINYNDNTGLVRIPLFETTGTDSEVVLKAIFLNQPGSYNGYVENDVVFVDFENNKLDSPVVIGKLYLGAVKESQSTANTSLTVSTLNVTSKATLPLDTQIINDKPTTSTIVNVDGDAYSYSSLEDVLKSLRKTEDSVGELTTQNSDYIAKIEVTYLSQATNLTPTVNDPNWQSTMPPLQDGYDIWQKTTCFNNRGQVLGTPEIICLTTASAAITYWVKMSTPVHKGTNQKESIKITAMVKIGTQLETEDKTASLKWKWQSESDEEWKTPTEEGKQYTITIAATDCIDKDLIIKAYHGETDYETETITFIAQNGPTLDLNNDTAQIAYDSIGKTKLDPKSKVSSTAVLYFNGKLVESGADFRWKLTNCTAKEGIDPETKTITITDIDEDSDEASATCSVTYAGTTCSKTFTITKARQGHTPYALHIENDFVSIATNSSGDFPAESLERTTHTIIVTRDNSKQAIRIYDSKATNITERIYIKATTTHVECEFSGDSITDNKVTLSGLSASEGAINYILYEKSGDNEVALASATFKVVKIIPGKDGKDGASGITYWIVSSANTHLGTQQDTDIVITAKTKSGNTDEATDNEAWLAWRFKDGTWSTLASSPLIIYASDFTVNKDIEVIATHKDTIDSDPSLTDDGVYEFETITYAPLNTPVLDLSNDSAAISYYWKTSPNPNDSSQLKKSKDSDTVLSTATVYYNNEKVPGVTYSWSPTHEGITISEVREDGKIVGSQITVKDLPADKDKYTAEYICTATVSLPNNPAKSVTLTKTFTVVKQIQGKSVTDYWLKLSTPIHTGSTNMSDITITAMKREGTDGTEKEDPQAFIWYRWKNITDSNWTLVPNTGSSVIDEYYTFTIVKENIEDADLEVIATHTPETANFNNLSEEDIYDSETITYSPANTPVIDLSQDKSDLNYDGNTKLDFEETETCIARLYLNGVDISDQADWEINPIDCTAELAGTKVTVEEITKDKLKGTVTFKATIKSDATNGAEKYVGKPYTKTFTITKKLKGNKGDKGDKGESATSYWLSISSPVHTGPKQTDDIKIQALTQVGETGTVEPIKVYFQVTGVASDFTLTNPTTEVTIPAKKVLDQNIKIKASFNKDLSNCFEEETITYSPLNTPILDLDNDSDFLAYNSSGVKLGEAKVSSTPTVYFNGEAVTAPGTFNWTFYKIDDDTGTEVKIETTTEADAWEVDGNTIYISKISTNNVKAVCAIDYTWNNRTTQLEKVFSVTKQIQGEDAIDYYLNISSPIHTGEAQTSNILIEAKKRRGVSGPEEPDTAAHLYWKYVKESTWTKGVDGKLPINAPLQNQDIEIIAARESLGNDISISNKKVYEVETITYSPLNTPVVDLSNDTDDLSYNAEGVKKIDEDESVTSTARLWLNGREVSSGVLTYEWEIPEGVTATGEKTATITISEILGQSASIPCTITVDANGDGIDGKFKGESYQKIFTVTKKLKGDKGDKGENGFNTISLHIENDRDSVPCTSDGTPASSYNWEDQTTHTITAFDGITPITFATVAPTAPTTDSENYTLVYKAENVGYIPGTKDNVLNYEASINSLSADTDTGKVIYKLYKGTTLLDSVSFIITKNKAGASTIKLSISNDFASIVCNSAGTPAAGTDWSITTHTLRVLDGTTEETFNLTQTKTTNNGYEVVYRYDSEKLTANIENKTITLTALNAEVGTITYDLYKDGTLVDTAKFEATKLIPGAVGQPGAAATSYYILATAYQIKKSKNETSNTPDKITFTAYSKTGTEDPKPIPGYWTYAIDDGSITNGSSNVSTQEITTANITKELKVNFYLDENKTKLVDRETIPVVADGDDLSDHYIKANVDTIKYDPKATPSYSATSIIFKFYSQIGLNEPTGLTLSKAYYTTKADGGEESSKISITSTIKENGITINVGGDAPNPNFTQSYTITLYDSKEEFLDSETVSIVANGTGAMSCVVESSAGTSFKKPLEDRTTVLTAHLYEGTVELDPDKQWFYEWYWFNNTVESESPTVITRSDDTKVFDENDKQKMNQIRLKLSDLVNKSVYFIAYPAGEPAEGTDVAILNVARLGLMALGK